LYYLAENQQPAVGIAGADGKVNVIVIVTDKSIYKYSIKVTLKQVLMIVDNQLLLNDVKYSFKLFIDKLI